MAGVATQLVGDGSAAWPPLEAGGGVAGDGRVLGGEGAAEGSSVPVFITYQWDGARTRALQEVTLPWRELAGELVTVPLVFSTRESGPLVRGHYNVNVWLPALSPGMASSRLGRTACMPFVTTTPAFCSTTA